jgi:hypothetical protein
MKTITARYVRTVGVFFLLIILAGCGGVKGDYTCKDGLLVSLKLSSGGKAYVTMGMFGQKIEKAGTYTVDGDKVNVVVDGESMLFTKSGKSLNGGDMLGTCTK